MISTYQAGSSQSSVFYLLRARRFKMDKTEETVTNLQVEFKLDS